MSWLMLLPTTWLVTCWTMLLFIPGNRACHPFSPSVDASGCQALSGVLHSLRWCVHFVFVVERSFAFLPTADVLPGWSSCLAITLLTSPCLALLLVPHNFHLCSWSLSPAGLFVHSSTFPVVAALAVLFPTVCWLFVFLSLLFGFLKEVAAFSGCLKVVVGVEPPSITKPLCFCWVVRSERQPPLLAAVLSAHAPHWFRIHAVCALLPMIEVTCDGRP